MIATHYTPFPRVSTSIRVAVHLLNLHAPATVPGSKAELSWEDFLPALNQSSIALSPFQLLYGYAPKLPTTNLQVATSASTFAQDRFLTFKRVLQNVEKSFADFQKEGEGYILKKVISTTTAATQHHNGSNQPQLAPNSPPKSHQEAFLRPNEWIQLINQPKQKKRKLIRAVRSKARQIIKDQQSEDPLINLINANQRPNILELDHKLITNQDLDIDPFTSEKRQFWTSLVPQERNT